MLPPPRASSIARASPPVVCALDEPGVLAPELAADGAYRLRVIRRGAGVDLGASPRVLARTLRQEGARLVHTHNAAAHLLSAPWPPTSCGDRAAAGALRGSCTPSTGANEIEVAGDKPPSGAPGLEPGLAVPRSATWVVAVGDDTAASVPIDDRARVPARLKVRSTIRQRRGHGGVPAPRRRRGGGGAGAPGRCRRRGSTWGRWRRPAAARSDQPGRRSWTAFARLRTRSGARTPTCTLVGAPRARSGAALEAHAARLGLVSAVTFAGERPDVAAPSPPFDVVAALACRDRRASRSPCSRPPSAGLPVVGRRRVGHPATRRSSWADTDDRPAGARRRRTLPRSPRRSPPWPTTPTGRPWARQGAPGWSASSACSGWCRITPGCHGAPMARGDSSASALRSSIPRARAPSGN